MVTRSPSRPDPSITERTNRARSVAGRVNVALESIGFALVVLAIALVCIPLAVGVCGAGLILIANRPERAEQGSADARTSTLP